MKITIEGWDSVDRQPVRGTLEGVDRAQTQAADLVTVHLQHGSSVTLKQNPTALKGSNIRVGACAWDGAYVLSAYLDAQPAGVFAGKRVVELGAGMGLVGLVLARLGAAVYLTDKPSMTVHARVNAAKNQVLAANPSPLVAVATKGSCNSNDISNTNRQMGTSTTIATAPAAGTAAVVGLDWEDQASLASAVASIIQEGPVDLVVATDCIYPDPCGTVPSSDRFIAAVKALAAPGQTKMLTTFEARSDELRQALLSAFAGVEGGCQVRRLERDVLPAAYQTYHIELYELLLC